MSIKQKNNGNPEIIDKDEDNPHRLLLCSCTSSISYCVSMDGALPIGFLLYDSKFQMKHNYH